MLAVTIPGGTGTPLVLVVEDEAAIRRLTARVLERGGFHVLGAAHGEEGLALARRHRGVLAAIVSDVMMPGLGGHAMVAALRAEDDRTPVLFLSGYSEAWQDQLRTSASPSDFLHKPWESADLLARVRGLMARARAADAGTPGPPA